MSNNCEMYYLKKDNLKSLRVFPTYNACLDEQQVYITNDIQKAQNMASTGLKCISRAEYVTDNSSINPALNILGENIGIILRRGKYFNKCNAPTHHLRNPREDFNCKHGQGYLSSFPVSMTFANGVG